MAVELVACPNPDCDRPAAVRDRYTVESTDGLVWVVATRCLDGHFYCLEEQP